MKRLILTLFLAPILAVLPGPRGGRITPDDDVPETVTPDNSQTSSVPDGSDLGALNDYLDSLPRRPRTTGDNDDSGAGDSSDTTAASGSSSNSDSPDGDGLDSPRRDTRPDGDYTDKTGTTYISTDSNGNRHIQFYKRHENGGLYLESVTLDRPDGSRRVYDWPGHMFGGSSQDADMRNARRSDYSSPQTVTPSVAPAEVLSTSDLNTPAPDFSGLNVDNFHVVSNAIRNNGAILDQAITDLEESRSSLDASDQAAVDAFDARVAELNAASKRIGAWSGALNEFYESNSGAIFNRQAETADRSSLASQYEFIDPADTSPEVEDSVDRSRLQFDLSRATRVLQANMATLEAEIAAYNALPAEQRDPSTGQALNARAAQLQAEANFQSTLSDHLQTRDGVPDPDGNPYSAHGDAVRRFNLAHPDTPINSQGLFGQDTSADEGRTIYSPEFAAAFGEIVGERVSGDPARDKARLDAALAGREDALENDNVGTGRVFTERVVQDAQGNVIGIEGEQAIDQTKYRQAFYDLTGQLPSGDPETDNQLANNMLTLQRQSLRQEQSVATDVDGVYSCRFGVNYFCRFTSSSRPRCWAASVR